MDASGRLTVYWQPGCSSCLRAREFLHRHGVEFRSVNVRERPEALAELERLGARALPVVTDGSRHVYAQDLAELARFAGIAWQDTALPTAVLAARLPALLAAARGCVAQIPEGALGTVFTGRDRSYRDLAFHVFEVAGALIDAAEGGTLTFDHFLRRPAATAGPDDLAHHAAQVEQRVRDWLGRNRWPATVDTYYGRRPFAGVLERTVWHAAQHCRQLEDVVRRLGVRPAHPLGPAELDGLPLPEAIWDDEVEVE